MTIDAKNMSFLKKSNSECSIFSADRESTVSWLESAKSVRKVSADALPKSSISSIIIEKKVQKLLKDNETKKKSTISYKVGGPKINKANAKKLPKAYVIPLVTDTAIKEKPFKMLDIHIFGLPIMGYH